MRLYYRKFIGLLTLNFCSSAFSGPFDFYSFTAMPKWQYSHMCALCVCLSPTAKACATHMRSWQPGRLFSCHSVDLTEDLQRKRHHQAGYPSQFCMDALIFKVAYLLVGACFEETREHIMHTHLMGHEDARFLTFWCLFSHATREKRHVEGSDARTLEQSLPIAGTRLQRFGMRRV